MRKGNSFPLKNGDGRKGDGRPEEGRREEYAYLGSAGIPGEGAKKRIVKEREW
jgi:hypothetical protein